MASYIRLFGDMLHLLALFVLLHKMLRKRSAAGISLKSMYLFALTYITRYMDLFFVYISMYNSTMKIFFILVTVYICFLMRYKNPWRATYDRDNDTFRIQFLILPCLALAMLFHRSVRLNIIVEVLWAFSQYLESVAILPQIFLLIYTGSYEALTSHYLFCLGMYRVMYLLHWIVRYSRFGKVNGISLVCGIVQSLLYMDFFYRYITQVYMKAKKRYELNALDKAAD